MGPGPAAGVRAARRDRRGRRRPALPRPARPGRGRRRDRCTTTTAPRSCRSSPGARTPTTCGRSRASRSWSATGEIWVRSPYVCDGYDGPPGPLRRDAGRVRHRRGPRACWSDGRLVVLGRPDAVTTGGATVPLADVEAVLRAAATGEVVVVGLPHQGLGAVLAAVLTVARRPRPGARRAARRRARRGAPAAAVVPRRRRCRSPRPARSTATALVSLVSGADDRATPAGLAFTA